jgi:hypothetical protein
VRSLGEAKEISQAQDYIDVINMQVLK